MNTQKINPSRSKKWGVLSLLFAVALCCFKWTPFSGVLSFVPVLGYLAIRRFGKWGLILSSLILSGFGIPFLIISSDRLFFSFFLAALLSSYYLLYLEREEAKAARESRENTQVEIASDLERLKKGTTSLQTSLIETEARNNLEMRALKGQVGELMAALQTAKNALEESIKREEELKGRLDLVESSYQKLQGSLYHDLSQEPTDSELVMAEEWKHRCEGIEQELAQAIIACSLAKQTSMQKETELLVLEKKEEEQELVPSQELEVLTRELQNLEEECQTLEKQRDSLEELVSLLLPFAKKQLQK